MRRLVSVPALVATAPVFAVILFSVAVWLTSRSLTSPNGYRQPDPQAFRFTETPATQAGLAYEEVAFSVPGGQTVRGWLVPAAQGQKDIAVVALHGRGGDRRAMLRHLPMLHDLGASVLLIDMRENGLSDGQGRGTGLGVREAEDASAAARELRRRGYGKVVVFGCSLGGSAAIIAAAQEASIDGVISESAIADFSTYMADEADRHLRRLGLNARWLTDVWGRLAVDATRWRIGLSSYVIPEDVISRVAPRPILLIHALRDPWVIAAHAHSLAQRGGPNVTLWQIDGAGHCDGIDVDGPEYRSHVAALIAKVEAGPGPE